MTVIYSPGKADVVGTSAEVTSFVGRTTELSDVSRLLKTGRLVTVLGPGGVGKSRVAVRAARQAADRYPGGMRVIELSELKDPALLHNTIAAGLGVMRQEMRNQLDVVLDYLRPRRLLLVLDTCEHLIEACALFAETVLDQIEGVTILATSRQPLDASGEYIYQIGPLPVPGGDELPDGAFVPGPFPRPRAGTALSGAGDAAELFAQRAASVDPEFKVTAGNWPDIARVCRRLDGIPLAIELAAVRMRALSLPELADRLDQRYDTLATRRVGTPRHQTLRTAIEWSYELCTEAECALWARLSVFAGSFGVAAVREVCTGRGLSDAEIVPALIGLVDKSVLVRDEDGRYRMLDTIREFGTRQLTEAGQDAVFRGRHVEYYLAAARACAGHFLDHDQPDRMRTLHSEHGNLRAAMRYGLSSDSERLVRDGAELAAALFGYWMVSGLVREGSYWLGLALDRLPAGPSRERAWALAVLGGVGPDAGMPEQAVTHSGEAVAMAHALGDEGMLLGRASWARMFALTTVGRLEEATAAGAQARPALEASDDRIGLMILESTVAHTESLSGNARTAFDACTRGLAMLREGRENGESGEQWLQGIFYLCAAFVRYFQGGYEDAARFCARALDIQAGRHDVHNSAHAIQGLGWLAAMQRRWGRAAWLLGGADALWQQLGARLMNDSLLEGLHQQTMDRVRRHLGDRRFENLFAEGSRCPLEQLAQYAIEDVEALPALPGPEPEATGKPARPLTRREREIAELVTEGLTNPEIAAKLSISKRTVDAHVAHIHAKLGVTSRVQLINRLLSDDGPLSGR